jgi:hypothetical protein
MQADNSEKALQARARLAGFLFLAVNALYVVSFLASMAGPEEIRRPAIAFQTIASAATIAMAWSFYEFLKPAGHGLALLALVFRVAEAALFGVTAIFSLLLVSSATVGASPPQLGESALVLARSVRFASGNVGQVYFCAGSAIFFYLLLKSRFIPRAISGLGLVATIVSLASALLFIGAPAFARYLAFSGAFLLLAETVTGLWLLIVGARSPHAQLSDLRDTPGHPA